MNQVPVKCVPLCHSNSAHFNCSQPRENAAANARRQCTVRAAERSVAGGEATSASNLGGGVRAVLSASGVITAWCVDLETEIPMR